MEGSMRVTLWYDATPDPVVIDHVQALSIIGRVEGQGLVMHVQTFGNGVVSHRHVARFDVETEGVL